MLSEKLGQFCVELASLAAEEQEKHGAPARFFWACLDRGGENSWHEHPKYSLSHINIRLDLASADALPDYLFVALTITLFDPGTFDLLRGGREAYRQWLVDEFLRQWKAAVEARGDQQLLSVLPHTRVWVHGQPSRLFGYDAAGKAKLTAEVLPESERAFIESSFKLGVDPAELGDEESDRPHEE